MAPDYVDNAKYKKMLGVYIKEQRERLQLSHSELSKASKINPSHLKKIEAGEVLMREKTFETLKQHLELDEAYIERIQEVAKMAFIDELFQLMNMDKEQEAQHELN